MKIAEAKEKLRPCIGVRFSVLMRDHNIDDIIVNKGKTGQLLEILIGSKNSPAKLDFEDGELKTNKCKGLGQPLETMFIMQVMSVIDELYAKKDFFTTDLYRKIDHFLYVPICKVGHSRDWYIIDVLDVNLNAPDLKEIRLQLVRDYKAICDKVISDTSTRGDIHTSSGEYIQIRTKDSKPYHAIFSKKHNKHVSNKNFAFYFKKEFMIAICKILRGGA